MNLTIHNITKITAVITEVRGLDRCPDHDLVQLCITDDKGATFELSLFPAEEYGGQRLVNDISAAITERKSK